jgi:transposase
MASDMRSKVEPVKEVAALVLRHLEGIVAGAQIRQANGFLAAINGQLLAARRRARGFTRTSAITIVSFQIAGRLDFYAVNLHARQPT